jgi:hypothetical protein
VKNPSQKPKAKAPSTSQRQKAPFPPSGVFINSCKQGGAAALREEHDIVTGETCLSASLNINNLGDPAVLLFPVCGQGCAYLSLQMKAIKLHLSLLMSSFHRLFIIHSPHPSP